MHITSLLTISALASCLGLAQAINGGEATVNFYYDTDCQYYAGTVTAEAGTEVGGPWGSSSGMYIELGGCEFLRSTPSVAA